MASMRRAMASGASAIVVRDAEEADAAPVAEIVAEGLASKYRPALGGAAARGIAALLRRDLHEVPSSRHLVAELDGRLAGAVHLALDVAGDTGFPTTLARELGWRAALRATLVMSLIGHGRMAADEAYVDELAVADWARRRGVARALLDACAQEGRRADRSRLTLWVTTDNVAARALYAAAGFRETRRRRWIAGRLLFRAPGAILMELPLAPG